MSEVLNKSEQSAIDLRETCTSSRTSLVRATPHRGALVRILDSKNRSRRVDGNSFLHTRLRATTPCLYVQIPYIIVKLYWLANLRITNCFIFYTGNRSIFILQKESYCLIQTKRKDDRCPYSFMRKCRSLTFDVNYENFPLLTLC